MAHQAKTVITPENRAVYSRYHRNKDRQDMTDKTPATKSHAREVRKQFEEIFATLTDSEARLLLHRFEDIFDWRTPRHLWRSIEFTPHDSDHAEWCPVVVKKGGVR